MCDNIFFARHLLQSLSGVALEHRKEMAKLMERYLDSTACRRQSLLIHFEGKSCPSKTTELKTNCCDNCLSVYVYFFLLVPQIFFRFVLF